MPKKKINKMLAVSIGLMLLAVTTMASGKQALAQGRLGQNGFDGQPWRRPAQVTVRPNPSDLSEIIAEFRRTLLEQIRERLAFIFRQ